MISTELCLTPPLANSYVEALILKVIVFGDRAFKEVIKVKWYHEDWDLIQ